MACASISPGSRLTARSSHLDIAGLTRSRARCYVRDQLNSWSRNTVGGICAETRGSLCTPDFRLALELLLAQLITAAVPVVAQDAATREAGTVVGTTGLNIRECPDVSCGSRGLAQLEDPIIVTGPRRMATSRWSGREIRAGRGISTLLHPPEARRSWKGPGLQASRAHLQHRHRRAAADTRSSGSRRRSVPATLFRWAGGRWHSRMTCGRSMLGFPIGTHGDVRLNRRDFPTTKSSST